MRSKLLIQGSLGRLAYGVLSLLLPKYLFAAIGMDHAENPDARYTNRLFGGRDIVIAVDTLLAVKGGRGKSAVFKNLTCEATDTISLVEELRERGKLDKTLIVGLLFNVFGYATWFRALLAGGPAAPVIDAAGEDD